MNKIFIGLLISFIIFEINCFAYQTKNVLLKNNIVIEVQATETLQEKKLGLGKRDSLTKNTGMIFVYNSPGNRIFWMKGMRFKIDIIWILKGKVAHIVKNISPPSIMTPDNRLPVYGSGVIADMVLEVPAGYSDKIDLKINDSVLVNP